MKRFLIALIVALTLAISGGAFASGISGLRTHNHSSAAQGGSALTPATIAMTGTHSSTKACAANFTRATPNFCAKNTDLSTTNLTRDACTAISLPAADAKALLLHVQGAVGAANFVAARATSVIGSSSNTCVVTADLAAYTLGVREFVAVTAGTQILEGMAQMILATTTPYIIFQDDGGDQGSAAYEVRGYFD